MKTRLPLFLLGLALAGAASAAPAGPALKEPVAAWARSFREKVGPAFALGEKIDGMGGIESGPCLQFQTLLGIASTQLPPSPDPEIDRLTKTGIGSLKAAAAACLALADEDDAEEAWTWYFFRGQADLRLATRFLSQRYGVPGTPELSAEYKGPVGISAEAVNGVLLEREANLGSLEDSLASAGEKRRRVLAWHSRYAAAAAPVKRALAEVLANPRDPGAACGRLATAASAFFSSPALPVPHPVLQREIEAAYRAFQSVATACLAGDPQLSQDNVDEAERHLGLAAKALSSYGLQP